MADVTEHVPPNPSFQHSCLSAVALAEVDIPIFQLNFNVKNGILDGLLKERTIYGNENG
jgi:hypothetical protein